MEVMTGTQSNPDNAKVILIEMFTNYNLIDFESIEIYKKCA